MSRSATLPNVAVVLASTGRPEMLAATIVRLLQQSMRPSQIVLSVVSSADAPDKPELLREVDLVTGPKGLPAQRNTGMRRLPPETGVVAFFDDDYLPSRHCIERIARFFACHPEVAGANGLLLGDGINSPGITVEEADRLIADHDAAAAPDCSIIRPLGGLYGCNMAYRATAIQDLWFDERLKLYGWQEDIDFAARASRRGRIVKTHAFAGVHLGIKSGRTSGVRLGYSQVINPLYLHRKGTMTRGFALRLLARTLIANHLKALKPEPWVDRVGRVRGNWVGLLDASRGRLTPERIEAL